MDKDKLPNTAEPVVFIVDDDMALREALRGLFRSVGLQAQTFGSAKEFLQIQLPDAPCCLILDVRLPGISGIDFQTELQNAGGHIPIIFVTGYGDVPMTVKAMKAGAVEFLTKPFRDQELLDAVRVALESHRDQREKDKRLAKIKACFDTLTPREFEVISLVSTGLMNKQIAGKLDISEITVKVHRVNGMRKIGARSMAELVRMADALGIKQAGVRR
jgi:FixJ family two-component response regulator